METTRLGGGAAALSAPSSALCTYTPTEWAARCAAHGADAERCRRLARASGELARERAAPELNLWASDSGRTGRGLRDRHFSRGTRLAWSIERTLALAGERTSDPNVQRAVHDANRAFAGCIDHGFVAGWVTTPVCGVRSGPDRTVAGPANAQCVALDGECRRGHYEAARGCCRQVELASGVACAESDDDRDDLGCFQRGAHGDEHEGEAAQLCNGIGQCVAARDVPAAGRVVGAASWIEAVRVDANWGDQSGPAPDAWHLPDGRIEVRINDAPIAIVPASAEGHRTRVASGPDGVIGIVALDIVGSNSSVARSLFVPRRVSANVVGRFDLCIATGRFDDVASVLPDCTGGTVVTCPTAPGATTSCVIDDRGFAVVTAPDLALAWERAIELGSSVSPVVTLPDAGGAGGLAPSPRDGGSDAGIVVFNLHVDPTLRMGAVIFTRPATFGRLVDTCARPSIPCTLDASSGCVGTNGVQVCVGGHYGTCIPIPSTGHVTIETCNGIDDDCDRIVDEGGNGLCGGLSPCSHDACGGAAGCTHAASPIDCRIFRLSHGDGPSNRTCESDICNGIGPLPSGAFRLTPEIAAGGPGNGCQEVLDDGFCTNTWDGCACNGSEVCSRHGAGADLATGCFAPPRFSPPAGGGASDFHDPCESDGDPCTDETICCEPNPSTCRLTRAGAPRGDAFDEGRICGQIATDTLVRAAIGASHPGTADGQTATCLNLVLPHGFAAQPANARVCAPDGNWCTAEVVSCAPATGLCTTTSAPRANGASGRDTPPPGVGPEVITVGWQPGGITIIPRVEVAACDVLSWGCGIGACEARSPGVSPTCQIIGPVPGTLGRQTDECFGDAFGYVGDAFDQPRSCYDLRCDPTGLGTCDSLIPRQERCDSSTYPPFHFAGCDPPVTCAPTSVYSGVPASVPGETRIGCIPHGCVIDGTCLHDGAAAPATQGCTVCNGSVDPLSYTSAAEGTLCSFAPDVNGICAGGVCFPHAVNGT